MSLPPYSATLHKFHALRDPISGLFWNGEFEPYFENVPVRFLSRPKEAEDYAGAKNHVMFMYAKYSAWIISRPDAVKKKYPPVLELVEIETNIKQISELTLTPDYIKAEKLCNFERAFYRKTGHPGIRYCFQSMVKEDTYDKFEYVAYITYSDRKKIIKADILNDYIKFVYGDRWIGLRSDADLIILKMIIGKLNHVYDIQKLVRL